MRFVSTPKLQSGMILGRDIIRDATLPMLKKGIILTDDYIKYFKDNGYMGVYILDNFSKDIEVEDTIRPEVVKQGIKAVSENNVGELVDTAVQIVNDIMQKDDLSVDLFDLRSFDDYTYHHSVNVAVYAVAVGRKMNLDKENIKYLSQAAIAHDLGKSKIPKEILNKHGKLTDEEYKIMQDHPKKSVEILNGSSTISAYVKQAVLMHHENENGSGYPLHKEGAEIPLLAKIIHAVDVYDALTSRRPYKDPYAPADAYDYLEGGAGILFDQSVLKVMEEVIPAFPPGLDVLLSNGEKGIVAKHTKDAKRPIIKIYPEGKLVNLLEDPQYKNVSIKASGVLEADYVGEVEELNEGKQRKQMKKTVGIVADLMSSGHLEDALSMNYKTKVFHSGMELMNFLRDNDSPDLLIIDLKLPDTTGIDLVNNLKDLVVGFPPFIFVSDSMDRTTVFNSLKAGATDFIAKPINPTYLRTRVERAINKIYDVD